ncbi:arylsulfatase B-like [Glandiceps talaboti]
MNLYLFFCCVLLAIFSRSDAARAQPHIVFILADDLGWADVGYHNQHVITPNIDQLANDGVKLTNAYVQPKCSPTRSAFLTGYYSHRIGMQYKTVQLYQPKGLPLNVTTIAEELRPLGYMNYMIGKWHLGYCNYKYTPQGRGFDKFYGGYMGEFDYVTHKKNNVLALHENNIPDTSRCIQKRYLADVFADKAVEYFQNHNPCKPMFMYLSFLSVHAPLQPPQEYLDMYPYVQNENRRKKLAMITAMDDAVGRVVEGLKSTKLWNDTILIFSSDNGGPQNADNEGNNWPLRGGKVSCWEGGTRAVTFVNSALLQKCGYNNTQMIHVTDWFPTIIKLAGGTLDSSRDHDGYDVWPAISNNDTSPRTEFVCQINEKGGQWGIRRTVEFRPISASVTVSDEDLPSMATVWGRLIDPTEQHELSAQNPTKLQELKDRLDEYRQKLMPAYYPDITTAKGNPTNFCDSFSYGWCDV